MNVEQIAKVAHEMNRALCQAFGDDSQVPWEEAPEWQRSSAINNVEFHIAHPDAGPEHSHNSWMTDKLNCGWKWGPIKDAEKKNIRPFVRISNCHPMKRQRIICSALS